VFPPRTPAVDADAMQNQPDIVPNDIEKLAKTIKSVFVSAWTNYKKQQPSNTVALELKRLSDGYFTDRETAATVSAIDLEPAADKPEL
jgi:hypothetical protein